MTNIVLESTLTCPHCGHKKIETMPTDACQWFYECENCKTVFKPKQGDCCVYCSYGDVPCPPIQESGPNGCCEVKDRTPIELAAEARSSAEVSATARVIANFALQHLKAATTFRDHVRSIEVANAGNAFGAFFEDIRSYGSACIMSTAASLEALVNEFFINPEGPLRKQLTNFEVEFWGRGGIEWKPPLEKYQIALEMLGKSRMDQTGVSFRNAWALFELRNALVHYKPTWDPDRQRKVELVEVLSGQYKLSAFPDSGADFVTMRTMSGDCMNWSIATAITFLREFDSKAHLDDHKMMGFWQIEE